MIVALVTDRRRLSPAANAEASLRCLIQQARWAGEAGIDLLQVHEPDLPAATLSALVREVVVATQGTRTRVVVNDRLDVALTAGAHGVHLRADSIDHRAVRQLAPSPFLIGCSVHSVDEALAASSADYLVAGTVWPTRSKPSGHSLLGVDGLSRVAAAVRVPVLAIGGVSSERVGEVAASGAAGIAAIGLFVGREEGICRAVALYDLVNNIRATFDTSGSAS